MQRVTNRIETVHVPQDIVQVKLQVVTFLIPILLGLVVTIVYLLPAQAVWFDDPYIYFQYVRNLAHGNGLTFNAGELSFGATSILWPLLTGFVSGLLNSDPVLTTRWIGIILYLLAAGCLAVVIQRATKSSVAGIVFGGVFVTYPSAVKIGLSGMEVGLAVFLLSLILMLLHNTRVRALPLGILTGLMFLSRPDSLVVLIALFTWLGYRLLLHEIDARTFAVSGLVIAAGFAVVVVPWLIYIHGQTGAFLPSSQAGRLSIWLPINFGIVYPEYVSMSLIERFINSGLKSLVQYFTDYRQVVLLTGLLGLPLLLVRHLNVQVRGAALFAALYALGLPMIYALSFPLLTFRYTVGMLLLGMYVVALYASWLYERFSEQIRISDKLRYGIVIGGISIIALAIVGMHYVTFDNYLTQVEQQTIYNETGRWLEENTPENISVALEPLGGLGYYSQRYMVDLGGLIHPEVVTQLPGGCSSASQVGAFLMETRPTHFADCSGLCLGRPAIEAAGIRYTEIFVLEADQPGNNTCRVLELNYPD